jgi:hypothetical protein
VLLIKDWIEHINIDFLNVYPKSILPMNRGCGCSGFSGGCECMGGCEFDWGDSQWLQIAIIILLIYLIYKFGRENYIGSGLGTPDGSAAAFTSGATLRRLGQKFSSTNQGIPMTIYNADLPGEDKAVHVVVYPNGSNSEDDGSI